MIRLDPRGGSKGRKHIIKEFYAPLKALCLPVKIKQMRYGDISFFGNGPSGRVRVGVEFKTLSDLLTCIVDKRLASHQLPGLVKTYPYRYLLVEGSITPRSDSSLLGLQFLYTDKRGRETFGFSPVYSSVAYPQLQKYLFTLENLANVRVRFTSTRADSIGYIAALYNWWQKDWAKHHSHLALPSQIDDHPRQIAILFRRPSILRRVASALPGIGWTRSKAVASAFQSVSGMVSASKEEWLAIPGIGVKTAEAIHKALRTKEKE